MPQKSQADRAAAFRTLHERPGAFIIPNPWDAGSAKMLAALGFKALATTSAGLAFSLGRRDGENAVARDEALAHAKVICNATDLPVSADLENCFGDDPRTVAETIRLAAEVGLVGGSVEDATGRREKPIYDFGLAVERVAAAVEAARSASFPFTLTARAENFLVGRADLDDTIRRLRAFEKAGADVLYAPTLPSLDALRTVCRSVTKPVNVLAGSKAIPRNLAALAEAGAKRISVGGLLARAAYGGFLRAAREMREKGSFDFADDAASFGEISEMMR
jgi:2-methylisocitrate lyase-like PEP mutase family enzyme